MLPSLALYKFIESTQSMKLSSYAQKLGIHYSTAYRMFKHGQIAGYQLPTGTVIIEEPVEQTGARSAKQQVIAVYARVSSSENKKNLYHELLRPGGWPQTYQREDATSSGCFAAEWTRA